MLTCMGAWRFGKSPFLPLIIGPVNPFHRTFTTPPARMFAHLQYVVRTRAERFAQFTADVIYDRAEGPAAEVYGGVLKAL